MTAEDYQTANLVYATAGFALHRAHRTSDGMTVLLKRLDPAHVTNEQGDRLRKEYSLLRSLNVAEIVKPLALIDEPQCLALVLEDFSGHSLETMMNGGQRVDMPTCLVIAQDLVQAVAGLHAAQIIHQDIRPANVLVDLDSGAARMMDCSVATAEPCDASLPHPFVASSGDWAYRSPEQTGRMNRPVDWRTDFYSLGITLYRLLTGSLPFTAQDPLEWAHCHIARMPRPPHEIAPELPKALSDIVMKLLAKRCEDRYQSAPGLLFDLGRCRAQWLEGGRIEPFPLATEDASDRFEIPHRLYGREQEMATLLAAFERMAAGGQPALVTVSGYSGIGKSSLVHELHKPIVRERGYFLSGKFDQFMRDIPYATLTQAFRELVQQLLAESESHINDWRQKIQAAVGADGQLIVDVLPQIEFIIGKQAPAQALPPTEAQNRFRRVFQQFISVFTRKEHPLVLFLDDLQWADAPSLQLIEHLLTHPDTRYLLLIAAYRDNEVSAMHPLTATLDAISSTGPAAIGIQLAPLSVMHLNQLVADALHAPLGSCESLTHVVFERSEGNPFFFTQFLDSLRKEGLLQWNATSRGWQWDLAQIRSRDFADNVADLMVAKLRQLPAETQQALQLAACLGNKFSLRHLAMAGRLPEDELGQHLLAAVREGLIARTDGGGKFLHDRIQQAAHALIPEACRAEMHLHIGRGLVATMTEDELAEHLFDVANQFNRGIELLVDRNEKARIAELNLRAGRKAKASTAYPSACVYFASGMALLEDNCWTSEYELAFTIWLERASCEFLTGNFEIAERLIAELLQRGASKTDKAAAYHVQVEICEVKSENRRAVENALKCLRMFGIEMSAHPSREQVLAEYDMFCRNLGERSVESLIDLPMMTNPEMLAAMHMLSALFTPAIFTDVNLLHLHLIKMANLTLKHGTTGASAHGYAWLGLFLGPVFHRYRDSNRFGKLAVDLVEKNWYIAYKSKIYLAMGVISFWAQPIKASIDFFRTSFSSGIATGDLMFACYSCNNVITARLARADHLDEVWRETEKGLSFARSVKFRDVADIIVSQQRFIQSMRGRTLQFGTFSDAQIDRDAIDRVASKQGVFEEAEFEAQLNDDRMATMMCWYWILKVQARFMSGDYEVALAAAGKAKALLWASDGFPQLLDYHYYTALAIAAICEALPPGRRRALRTQLTECCTQLKEWAENCSAPCFDRHALVAAEVARIEGRALDAMHLYEQAIQAARDNGFVHSQGVAYELASVFYRTRGFQKIADSYLQEARSCFVQWGADGKVKQLDERFPQSRAQPASVSAVPLSGVAQLDLLSIAKASQAISGRIVLEELVDTLLRIVLESAGAQNAHLLLVRNGIWVLAAEADVQQQVVQVRLRLGKDLPDSLLPASVLNYVRRSREQVLLADVAQPNPFSNDPYFARQRPSSLLCLPILRQAELIGLLYLEHGLVTHAFTPQRLAVLELLAAQAAISLENALLYADLRQENSDRRRAEEALREEQARIRRLVESNIIGVFFWNLAGHITDANEAFLGLVGYSRHELLSGEVQWKQMTPPEYLAADARALEDLRNTGTSSSYEKEGSSLISV